MPLRAVVSLIAALSLAAAGWAAVRAGGTSAPSRDEPVTVGSLRVAAGELEAAAARSAGARPGRLAAARMAAADRAIERLWLEGEAAARELRPAKDIAGLRAQVADALAGGRRPPDAAHLATAFDAFHERWRARTRCLAPYRDADADRCGDAAGAAAGTCRWMGEATVCAPGGGGRAWLVVHAAPSARATAAAVARASRRASRLLGAGGVVARARSRAGALAVARAVYVAARTARTRTAAATRAAAKRAAADRTQAAQRARLAGERRERARDPLTGAALAAAQDACRRQLRDSEPYMFGFGMQDVAGQARGLIAARAALARGLAAAAADAVDGRKLRPLVDAVAAGNRELVRVAGAGPATVAARAARFDARTEPERAISRRLGLGDCLARPAR